MIKKLAAKKQIVKSVTKRKMVPFGGKSQDFVQWILSMDRKEFPVQPDRLLFAVRKIIKESGKKTIFKDSKLGRFWFATFLKRYPEIKNGKAEAVSKFKVV